MKTSRRNLVTVCGTALTVAAASAPARECLSPTGRFARGWTEAVAASDDSEFIFGSGTALMIRHTGWMSTTYTEVEIGAMVLGIAVADDYVYVVGDGGLRIVDLLAPDGPAVVGHCPMSGVAEAVEVLNGRAYVAGGDRGMRVVDVSVPTDPRVIGATDTSGWAADVAVDEVDGAPIAVVADSEPGLLIIDATDPEELETVVVEDYYPVFTVEAADAHVYGANPSSIGLTIVDISTPAQPVVVGGWLSGSGAIGYSHSGLAVSGGVAYLAGKSLWVLDVADPTQIVELHDIDIDNRGRDVAVADDRIAVSSGESAEFFSPSGVAPPYGPSFDRATWHEHWIGADGMTRVGEFVVAFKGEPPFQIPDPGPPVEPGLQVYDISQTGQPTIVGRGLTGQFILDVEAEGDLVVVVTSQGTLGIVDLTDPYTPLEIGLLPGQVASGYLDRNSVDLEIEGDLAVVAGNLGLVIVDISDPRSPSRLSELPGPCFGLEIEADRAYVADEDGIHLVDLADPSSPFVDPGGRFELEGGPSDFEVADGFAYLLSEFEVATGLTVVDLDAEGWSAVAAFLVRLYDNNLMEPVRRNGTLNVAGERLAVALRGPFQERSSVAVFDISDPSEPVEIGATYTPGEARGVLIDGRSLYVADGHGGLGVYDGRSCLIELPGDPFELPRLVEDR